MGSRQGVITLAVVFAILLGEIYYLKLLPYSFVSVYRTSDIMEFNRVPTQEMTVDIDGYDFHYRIPHRIHDDRFRQMKQLTKNGGLKTMDCAIILSNWVRSQLLFGKPDYNSEEILLDDIINESKNNDLNVLCDSYARLFVLAAQALGIPARIVELSGHVVPEAFIREMGKWVMIDPTNGYYLSKNGKPLSVAEIILCYREGISPASTVFAESRGDDCLYSSESEVRLKEIYLNGFTKVSDQNVDREKIVNTLSQTFQLPIVVIQFLDGHSAWIGYQEELLRYAVVITFVGFVLMVAVVFRKNG